MNSLGIRFLLHLPMYGSLRTPISLGRKWNSGQFMYNVAYSTITWLTTGSSTMSFCPQYLPKLPWIVKTRNGLILHYFETKFKKKIFQIFSPNTQCAPHILRKICPGKRRRRHWRKQRVPSQCPHRWPTFHERCEPQSNCKCDADYRRY